MLIVKAVLLVITLYVAAYLSGSLVLGKEEERSLSLRIVLGLLVLWAVFYVAAVPIILLQPNTWGFTANLEQAAFFGSNTLVKLYGGLVIVILILAVVRLAFLWKERKNTEVPTPEKKLLTRTEILYLGLFLALVLFQLVRSVLYAYADGDDAYYVAVAQLMGSGENTLYQTDAYTGNPVAISARYALAPFPIWAGFLARIFDLNAAVVCHVCLPVALIPMTYMIYERIGEKLFEENREKKFVFLCLVAVFVLFAHYSYDSAEVFLLTRTRQGKEALACIIIPFLFLILLDISLRTEFKIRWMDLVKLMITGVAGALTSVFGNVLTLIMLFGFGIYTFMRHAKWSDRWKIVLAAAPSLIILGLYALN